MGIIKRNNSWYCNFYHRGKRYNGCIGPVSKTKAMEVFTRKKAEAVEGRFVSLASKPSPRLDQFVQEYFDFYRGTHRPRATERHETSWTAIQPILGTKRLDEITPHDLEKYRRHRQLQGRSDVTINRELGFLKNLYTIAIDWEKVDTNPVKKVRFAREGNARVRFLSCEEEERLLSVCKEPLKPVVVTALHTGFRKSELLSLT